MVQPLTLWRELVVASGVKKGANWEVPKTCVLLFFASRRHQKMVSPLVPPTKPNMESAGFKANLELKMSLGFATGISKPKVDVFARLHVPPIDGPSLNRPLFSKRSLYRACSSR